MRRKKCAQTNLNVKMERTIARKAREKSGREGLLLKHEIHDVEMDRHSWETENWMQIRGEDLTLEKGLEEGAKLNTHHGLHINRDGKRL